MVAQKITSLPEGTVLDPLDWLVSVDVSDTTMAGGNGSDVKVRLGTVLTWLGGTLAQKIQPITSQSGTTYTGQLADQQGLILFTNVGAITLTMPQFSSIAFPVGSWFEIIQLGAGAISFLPEGGVAGFKTSGIGARVLVQNIATDTWHISGALVLA